MPQKCSICKHPKRAHINRALMNPKRSLRSIARQYDTSVGTLSRHKEHIASSVDLAKKNGAIKAGKTAYEQFMALVTEAETEYKGSSGNLKVRWFEQRVALLKEAFRLGIEAQREREKQVFNDVTPAVQDLIDKVMGNDKK